ncbi:MAG: hypothetical protein AB7P37_02105 [Ramlibacter sp.]
MNPLQPHEFRLLAEIGCLAGQTGDLMRASTIFSALETCRPDAAIPYVGMSVALLLRRNHPEVLSTLDRGLKAVSPGDRADVHAFRALALHMAGRIAERDRAIHAAGDHPLARALALEPLQRA